MSILRRDIGKIRNNEIENPINILKQVAFHEMHTVAQAKPLRVFPGEAKRLLRNIGPGNFCLGKFRRQSERDYPAAGSDIKNFGFRISDFGFQYLYKFLRFRPWNHCAFIAEKNVAAKFHRAEQMLKRLAFTASPDQFAQRRQFGFGQLLFKFEIKLKPFPS